MGIPLGAGSNVSQQEGELIYRGVSPNTLTLSHTSTADRSLTIPDVAGTLVLSSSTLTSGRIPIVTTGGVLTDDADLSFASDTLSTVYLKTDSTNTNPSDDIYNFKNTVRLTATSANAKFVFNDWNGVVVNAANTANWTASYHNYYSFFQSNTGATGTYAIVRNYGLQAVVNGGTVTDYFGYHYHDPSVTAPGVITNQYAVYIETPTAATTNNWAIYVQGGKSYFGGALTAASYVSVGTYLLMATNGQGIYAPNVDNNWIAFSARDNGVGLAEVGRLVGAADPYFSFGGSQQFKFYNSGYLQCGGYIDLFKTDTDGAVEGRLWYDDSENVLKYYNGAAVKTVAVV